MFLRVASLSQLFSNNANLSNDTSIAFQCIYMYISLFEVIVSMSVQIASAYGRWALICVPVGTDVVPVVELSVDTTCFYMHDGCWVITYRN